MYFFIVLSSMFVLQLLFDGVLGGVPAGMFLARGGEGDFDTFEQVSRR